MNQTEQTVAESRSRKRKALLAGGVVLGLGATVTLAAWTDDVWVSGAFSAGTFNVQGAVDAAGDDWRELATSDDSGALEFTVSPSAMAPGDSVYAPLNLRVDPESSGYDAEISLPTAPTGPASASPPQNQAFFNALRVTLYGDVAPAQCSVGEVDGGAPLDGFNNVSLDTVATETLVTLGGDGSERGVCFEVTLPEDAPPDVQGGATGDLLWNFKGESVEQE